MKSCKLLNQAPPDSFVWWNKNINRSRRTVPLIIINMCRPYPPSYTLSLLGPGQICMEGKKEPQMKELYLYRWARNMEDEDIAPNSYSWSCRYGQKVMPVHYMYWNICDVLARLSAPTDWIGVCIWRNILVFILRAHLYTTPLSMGVTI